MLHRALKNQLLAALAAPLPNIYDSLIPDLKRVPLKKDCVLFKVGESPTHVCFLISSAVSTLANVERRVIEAAMVGCEGAIGLSEITGRSNIALSAEVQIEGQALDIEAKVLRQAFQQDGEAYGLFIDCMTRLIAHLARISIRNKHHPTRRRLASKLLSMCMYSGSNSITIAHADLARSIGGAPSMDTEILYDFRRAGVVGSGRGRITILNQFRLKQIACSCHNFIRHEKHISPVGAPT